MAFARAHDSRDRVAVRGKALLITASEWRQGAANSNAAIMTVARLFTEHDFEAEPHRADKAGGNYRLEVSFRACSTPCASALNAESQRAAPCDPPLSRTCQDGCDGPQYHRVDICYDEPMLLGHVSATIAPISSSHDVHRLMILATFSNPRLAK